MAMAVAGQQPLDSPSVPEEFRELLRSPALAAEPRRLLARVPLGWDDPVDQGACVGGGYASARALGIDRGRDGRSAWWHAPALAVGRREAVHPGAWAGVTGLARRVPESLWHQRAWARACGGLERIRCSARDELFAAEAFVDANYARADDGAALLVLQPGEVPAPEIWLRTCAAQRSARGLQLASRADVNALRAAVLAEQRLTGLWWTGTRWEVSGMVVACFVVLAEKALRARFVHEAPEGAVLREQAADLALTWLRASAQKVFALWDRRELEQWLELSKAALPLPRHSWLDTPEACRGWLEERQWECAGAWLCGGVRREEPEAPASKVLTRAGKRRLEEEARSRSPAAAAAGSVSTSARGAEKVAGHGAAPAGARLLIEEGRSRSPPARAAAGSASTAATRAESCRPLGGIM